MDLCRIHLVLPRIQSGLFQAHLGLQGIPMDALCIHMAL